MKVWISEYMLNALWQVLLVQIAAAMASRVAKRLHPGVAHRIWVIGLVSAVILPAVRLDQLLPLLHWSNNAASESRVQVTFGAGHLVLNGLQMSDAKQTILQYLFLAAFTYGLIRLLWSTWRASRLRTESQLMVLDAPLQEIRHALCRQIGVATVHLRVSKQINGPAVVGANTVLLPIGFVEQASHLEFQSALAHELAHVRRRDFYKNLAYASLALPLLWHPGSWLLRRGIDESREMVCDMMAAEAVGVAEDYARSLLRIAQRMPAALNGSPATTVGMFQRNTFERRVTMLMKGRRKLTRPVEVVVKVMVLSIGLAAGAALASTHLDVHAVLADGKSPKKILIAPDVMAGNILSHVSPVYPPAAKAQHLEGKVVLSAVIGPDGTAEALRVVSSPDQLLSTSALDAVRQWKWKPYLLNGNPVEVSTEVNILYSLGK